MIPTKFTDDARSKARALLASSTRQSASEPRRSLGWVIDRVKTHPVTRSPVLAALRSGRCSIEALRAIHLDFRFGGVDVFIDSILMAQYRARDLLPRFGREAQMAARFLLALNLLDELGFDPASPHDRSYGGRPEAGHPLLFEAVLRALFGHERPRTFTPSPEAVALRARFEASSDDLIALLAMIVVTEEVAMLFTPAMREAVRAAGVDVESGYYFVHGTTQDTNLRASDDLHQLDAWLMLEHIVPPSGEAHLAAVCLEACGRWERFWARQHQRTLAMRGPPLAMLGPATAEAAAQL